MLSILLLCSALAVPTTPDVPHQDAPPDKADKQGKQGKQDKQDKGEAKTIAQLERALRAAERSVRRAGLELALAESKNDEEALRARIAIDEKARALDFAQRELEICEALEVPAALEAAQLSVDRAESRLISEKQDLEGILRIYAEEEEATAKNEIIRRHEVSVEFAEREVAASLERRKKAEADGALATNKKRFAIEKAKGELELAQRGLRSVDISIELSKMKARDALESATEDRDEAGQALEKRTAEQAGDEEGQ
ncbi:MAG: hypothetical protein O2816_18975 [Planctomycetota bacterium]|nr:hypothetical protein [Planctomycetota bacterium]